MYTTVTRFFGVSVVTLALLGGCAPMPTAGKPDPREVEAVGRGDKAIVLFRYSATQDREPHAGIDSRTVAVADIDAAAPLSEDIRLRAPTEDILKEGWRYIVLNPGNYYLLALPPGLDQNPPAVALHADSGKYGRLSNRQLTVRSDAFWYAPMQQFLIKGREPEDFELIPGFLLQIPQGGKVFYVGSLNVACGSIPGVFGRLPDACSAFQIEDESDAAYELSGSAFGAHLPFATRLLISYGSAATRLDTMALDSLGVEIGIDSLERGGLAGPEPAPLFLLPGGGAGSVGTARAFGVFNVMSLLAYGAQKEGEEQEARQRAAKWSPCFEHLEASIGNDYVLATLRGTLENAIREKTEEVVAGAPAASSPNSAATLKVTWLGSGLRECADQGLACVEIALRVRLEEPGRDTSRYDTILVYSNDYRSDPLKTSFRRYQSAVSERSRCRPIEAYCTLDGQAIVREEIEMGIHNMAARILSDLTGRN